MAGDLHYIYIMDDDGNIVKELYLGKLRYWCSVFSLVNYKYHDDSRVYDRTGNNESKGKYYNLVREASGKESYSVLHLDTINEIRNVLNDKPLNDEEEEAYEDTKIFINFVDKNLDIIKKNNYDVVFHTSHDY
jgi:hypothetical protein